MRRKDREITSLPEIREIVNSATECHLALNDDGTPYGITLNYGFEEENGIFTLYFHKDSGWTGLHDDVLLLRRGSRKDL